VANNSYSTSPQFKIPVSAGSILLGLLGLFFLIGLFSGFYTVPVDSVAVVQRFGKHLETTDPGLRLKLPWGIDTATIVPLRRQLKLEFGFGTGGGTNAYQFSDQPEEERSMVTGDLNAANVEWVVQYHISDPEDYLFHFKDPIATLRDLSEAVMREVVGDRTVDEVLTFGRQEMSMAASVRLQGLVETLGLGVAINTVQLQDVKAPAEVQASFDEVNRAQQEKEQAINMANGEYNRQLPRSKGEAEQKISAATGYASKRINEAEGDANRFLAVLTEYKKAPEVTRRRVYLETMAEILPLVRNKVIIDDKAPQFLPMMQLPALKAGATATAPVSSDNRPSSFKSSRP
jgi:modulator of FtsH protease HflK